MQNNFRKLKQQLYKLFPRIYEVISKNSIYKYKYGNRPNNSYLHPVHKISNPQFVFMGDNVTLEKDLWINAISEGAKHGKIYIKNYVKIGQRCTLSSINSITIEKNVLLGLNVYVADHEHVYKNIHKPIMYQGIEGKGNIVIKKNAWIGNNVLIFGKDNITIGENSVIGANSVVKKSVPNFCVAVGNPAVVVKKFNNRKKCWVEV